MLPPTVTSKLNLALPSTVPSPTLACVTNASTKDSTSSGELLPTAVKDAPATSSLSPSALPDGCALSTWVFEQHSRRALGGRRLVLLLPHGTSARLRSRLLRACGGGSRAMDGARGARRAARRSK
jgi:hypothetical protein